MAATDFIVAIELGSSKITGIAGKKHPDGSIGKAVDIYGQEKNPTTYKYWPSPANLRLISSEKELFIIWTRPHKALLRLSRNWNRH